MNSAEETRSTCFTKRPWCEHTESLGCRQGAAPPRAPAAGPAPGAWCPRWATGLPPAQRHRGCRLPSPTKRKKEPLTATSVSHSPPKGFSPANSQVFQEQTRAEQPAGTPSTQPDGGFQGGLCAGCSAQHKPRQLGLREPLKYLFPSSEALPYGEKSSSILRLPCATACGVTNTKPLERGVSGKACASDRRQGGEGRGEAELAKGRSYPSCTPRERI